MARRSRPNSTRCCSADTFPGPNVLAGHSFGGLYVLTFAARYPDEVAGMVLVDSTAPASRPQNRMATLSTNSVHRVIDGATHEGLVANEEDAATATHAILDVVSSVRSPRRLVR